MTLESVILGPVGNARYQDHTLAEKSFNQLDEPAGVMAVDGPGHALFRVLSLMVETNETFQEPEKRPRSSLPTMIGEEKGELG